MKFATSHLRSKYFTAELFHMAKPYFTRRRANFVEKSTHCLGRQMCAFFWRRSRESNSHFSLIPKSQKTAFCGTFQSLKKVEKQSGYGFVPILGTARTHSAIFNPLNIRKNLGHSFRIRRHHMRICIKCFVYICMT